MCTRGYGESSVGGFMESCDAVKGVVGFVVLVMAGMSLGFYCPPPTLLSLPPRVTLMIPDARGGRVTQQIS